MRADPRLDIPLFTQAARATAAGSKSFYFATRFFPRELARAAHAVYWFCRHTDDLVDEAPSLAVGQQQLDDWSGQLEAALSGAPPSHPILILFIDTVQRYQIPHEYPRDLIAGMRMDLHQTRYRTFEELRVFCYRVASVVGIMMSHVIGFRQPAPAYAIDLGIAMQLTNILRDIGEDLDRCRIYLPQEELDRFGVTIQDLHSRRITDAFRELMAFQVARARQYYEQSLPGIALLNPEGRFAVKIAADVYGHILHRIEDSHYDVFHRRAVVPAMTKYYLTARSMALPMARHFLSRY